MGSEHSARIPSRHHLSVGTIYRNYFLDIMGGVLCSLLEEFLCNFMLNGWIPSEQQAKMFSIAFQKGEEEVVTDSPGSLGRKRIKRERIELMTQGIIRQKEKEVKELWNLIFSKVML